MEALLIATPLALQAAATLVDEFHFHHRRQLPLWERIGHPLDTCTVAACLAISWTAPATTQNVRLYVVAAAFSCLFVTKDEFVHARACDPVEHWLHAVLFVLHPVTFGSIFWLWEHGYPRAIGLQLTITLLFGIYQTLYWNTSWLKGRVRP